MKKCWNMEQQDEGGIIWLDSEISDETWLGDEVTPTLFREELDQFAGQPVTVWINSPGGDVVAASQIYTALKEYSGTVTVKIDGLAASAASVVAMAGDMVCISPTGMLMIHNPATIAFGNAAELADCIDVLNEYKESIINAYQLKTGLSRAKLARLMDEETWMNAGKALELGFVDKILFTEAAAREAYAPAAAFLFSKQQAIYNLAAAVPRKEPKVKPHQKELALRKAEFDFI